MVGKTKPRLSRDLTEAIKQNKPFAKRGYSSAVSAIRMLDTTVNNAVEELQKEIDRLKKSKIRDEEIHKSLTEQLTKIKSDYSLLPIRLEEECEQLSQSSFTITVFGRTMVGKSTLMEILTHGDGSSIGKGAQRTTKNVRRYKYKSLQMVDVPGVAAFDGKEDETIAFDEAKRADLIFFIIPDEDIQPSVAECLCRVVSLGKPIVCIMNIRSDIGNEEITPLQMKVFKQDLNEKMQKEHIEGIKKQLFEYGKHYGQNWRMVRFAYVHLKAAFLSQQSEFKDYAVELYQLSRFEYIERIIVDEITRNGKFYKLKAYTEIVSVPLADSIDTLFEQSAQNSHLGSMLLAKRKLFTDWIKGFKNNSDNQIEAFLTSVNSELKKEVSVFAENNYDNRNASKEWNEVIEKMNIEQRAQNILIQLGGECENELAEISRETEFDLKFSNKLASDKSLNMHRIVDGKKIWNWATIIVSGTLIITGLFVAAPLTWVGIGVSFLNWLGDWLFSDYEKQAKNARKELELKLTKQIDKMIIDLRKSMNQIVATKLLQENMYRMESNMNDAVSSLFALSEVQHKLAKRLNEKMGEISKLIVAEALKYDGYEGLEYHINELARIPGVAIMIVIDDGKRFPDEAKRALSQRLKEQIWFVFHKENLKSVLGQAIGNGCDRNDISIQMINGEPRIAHIPSIDRVDEITRNRIRMAQQLTGLLIMQ